MPEILIERFQGELTVIGQSVQLRDVETTLDGLLASKYMEPWIKTKMSEHLDAGGSFEALHPDGRVASCVRIATQDDMRKLAAEGSLEAARGAGTNRTKKRQQAQAA